MAHDLPGVELFVAEDHAEEGALARPVAADEPDAAVVRDRRRGVVQEHLLAVPLAGPLDVEKDRHGRRGRTNPGLPTRSAMATLASQGSIQTFFRLGPPIGRG